MPRCMALSTAPPITPGALRIDRAAIIEKKRKRDEAREAARKQDAAALEISPLRAVNPEFGLSKLAARAVWLREHAGGDR